MQKTVIRKYSKTWPRQFSKLAAYLEKNNSSYIRIEHVGSTAVPGMYAKPVIDIDIEIASEEALPAIIRELEAIGYVHNGNQGIEGREAFKRPENRHTIADKIRHHLYVCTSGNAEYERHILFRDRLRADISLRNEYNRIKQEILERAGTKNRQGYVELKEKQYGWFFQKVLV